MRPIPVSRPSPWTSTPLRGRRHFAGLGLSFLLLACGGGGGDSSDDKREGGLPAKDSGIDASAQPDARAPAPEPDSATVPDARTGGEAGMPDAAVDAGPTCVAFAMPTDCTTPPNSALPAELRCTGLYGDFEARAIACGVQPYAPAHQLWTDGAVKQRYVSLPPGATIDVTDPDEPVYPVGTQFWKEFKIQDGKGGTRLGETRLLRKVEAGWLSATYVWNETATDALQVIDGVTDLFGLGHTVPTRDQCKQCHNGRKDFVLGWDPIMLGQGAKGITWQSLLDDDLLSTSAGSIPKPSIPGNAEERAALGYLHANCGVSCHNRNSGATALLSGLYLRLNVNTLGSVQETDAYTVAINKTPSPNIPPTIMAPASGAYFDIRPLDLERSLLVARMKLRGDARQMPLIGTNVVDQTGVDAVSAWIGQMSVANGYPAAAP